MRRRRDRCGAAERFGRRPGVDDNWRHRYPVGAPAGVPGHSVGRTNYCRQHHDRHYSGVGTADHPGSVGAADLEPAAVSDTDAHVAYGEGDDSDVDRHNVDATIVTATSSDDDAAGWLVGEAVHRGMTVTMQGGLEECET